MNPAIELKNIILVIVVLIITFVIEENINLLEPPIEELNIYRVEENINLLERKNEYHEEINSEELHE